MKSNVYFNNSSILFPSSIQVYQFFSIVLFHSFLGKSNIFLQHLIPTIFPFYDIFYFYSRELSRELGSLHILIRCLILQVISVWKRFNSFARLHTCILYVCVKLKNHHNIFLVRSVGHIFVKHRLVDSFFVEDGTKIEK